MAGLEIAKKPTIAVFLFSCQWIEYLGYLRNEFQQQCFRNAAAQSANFMP